MKPLSPLSGLVYDNAPLEKILAVAGMHQWSPPVIDLYMKRERKKLRANGWYYLAKAIPVDSDNLGSRLEEAAAKIFFAMTIATAAAFVVMLLSGASYITGHTGHAQYMMLVASGLVLIFSALGASFLFLVMAFNVSFTIRGPGYWKTVAFDTSAEQYATTEVLERIKNLKAMMPDARLEVSLLYQNEWMFDPVLWLITKTKSGTDERRAILVWDVNDNIVLPHV